MRATVVFCLCVFLMVESAIADEDKLPKNNKGLVCKPHTAEKVDCNTCVCNDSGTYKICTREICPPQH